MRQILAIVAFMLCEISMFSQTKNSAYTQYIEQYKGWAIEQMQKYRIPASITLAQGILESNAGRSTLATQANNHFGIKVGANWSGPYVLKDDDAKNEKFRKYASARESYKDHSEFLQGKRYQGLYQLSATDYKGWARGLKAAGYATNPSYAEALIQLIETYNLTQYDTGKYQQPKRNTDEPTSAADLFFKHHPIFRNNGNYFIVVRAGDDMATISKMTGLSLRKLYTYNDLPYDYAPTEGDLVYLKKKRKEASKQYKHNPIHIVEPGQSMFDISQIYGIRMESLYKLNQMAPDHQIQPKDILRIR